MIGAPVPRLEDGRFLTGRGRYVDDLAPAGTTSAYMLRSPHAHARILSIDTRSALASPGVLGVFTGEDLQRDDVGGLPCLAFPQGPFKRPLHPVLVRDTVRHVGDRVALIVAETLAQAKDAADLVEVSYEPLPAVTRPEAGEVAFELEHGDGREVAQAFARAAHVATLELRYPRAISNAMEPRAALAYREALDGRYTLCSSSQCPWQVRDVVAQVLGIAPLRLRVLAPDVGGGFGTKAMVYPEEVLVLWAARRLERPVKWTAERSESFLSDTHGRDQLTRAELALAADGRILALRVAVAINVGAYLSTSAGVPPHNATISYSGMYDIPLIYAVARAAFTHTSPLGPYRGSAKPEASYVTERLMDCAAREMGVDAVELRRRNLVRAFPHRTAGGYVYDCGEFDQVLKEALQLADWNGFEERRRETERRGLRRGIGIALHCQRAGNQSERMELRVLPGGSVAVHVGTLSHGQGHETVFAQMVAQWLCLEIGEVQVFQGDTDRLLHGRGTFAQRSMIAGGSALKLAADEILRKGKRFAAWLLEAAESDIHFQAGAFRVKGTDRLVSWSDVARRAYQGTGVPADLGMGWDAVGSHPGPNTFPNGCMICEVEVDPETGLVQLASLCAVDDTGTVINPLVLDGQLHGSIAQGLGEALMEDLVYDPSTGQLVSGSLMDYALPRASDVPPIHSEVHPVPTSTNPLGVKGGAEAGNAGAPAAIVNAILDALSPWNVPELALPVTSERVWAAITGAGPAASPQSRAPRLPPSAV